MGRPAPAWLVAPVDVTARTVRVDDILVVGSAYRTVGDLRAVDRDRRHLLFVDGSTLVIGPEPLPVLRPQTPRQLVTRTSGWRR
ncbi:hypothetical protein KDA82_28210 [Streptomyces daliensis]|uniref:Uncharacterized protein n=1 Tax=Streptomyces daliensis TaxID=299421 RepID=A0A8T4IWK3_9ACTN|nr:hypothetical protein [Streptomyces daliensis]